jgi:hypothetical protein
LTANLLSGLGGVRPGVAFMLPTLTETHAVLWAAETVGSAVPINFLLQPAHIRGLLEASHAIILVTLWPHAQLDIWEKSLELQRQMPNPTLVRVAPPGTAPVEGVIDYFDAIGDQPADHLIFDSRGHGDDVAAYFHTGGTTGVPKLAAHSHNGQLTAAFGCAGMMNLGPDDVLTGTASLPVAVREKFEAVTGTRLNEIFGVRSECSRSGDQPCHPAIATRATTSGHSSTENSTVEISRPPPLLARSSSRPCAKTRSSAPPKQSLSNDTWRQTSSQRVSHAA